MVSLRDIRRSIDPAGQSGYSLVELMIALGVLTIVSGTVFDGVLRMTRVNNAVHNRSEMHSGVRNATELLQQEIGQAGRIALPGEPELAGAVVSATFPAVVTVQVSSTEGMFMGMHLVVDTGEFEETVTLTAVNTATDEITASFVQPHDDGVPLSVRGGFSAGVVPTTMTDGSTASVLKIFGDIHSDGQMVYVEYTCDTETANLYRNVMPITEDDKPQITVEHVLLNNILENPDETPCFTYQEKTVNGTTFVTQVAVTLTVQTEREDPITGAFQTETKALLNVSPRNVFHVWQIASLQNWSRVQPMPASVEALLP
jgi:prepilin-type N-terminal cleavage/methylation domain-containing protein